MRTAAVCRSALLLVAVAPGRSMIRRAVLLGLLLMLFGLTWRHIVILPTLALVLSIFRAGEIRRPVGRILVLPLGAGKPRWAVGLALRLPLRPTRLHLLLPHGLPWLLALLGFHNRRRQQQGRQKRSDNHAMFRVHGLILPVHRLGRRVLNARPNKAKNSPLSSPYACRTQAATFSGRRQRQTGSKNQKA